MNIYKKAIRDGAPDGAGKARKMGCTSVQKNKKKARKTGLLAPPVRFERTTPWINNSASLRRAFPCGSSKPHLLRKIGKSLSVLPSAELSVAHGGSRSNKTKKSQRKEYRIRGTLFFVFVVRNSYTAFL